MPAIDDRKQRDRAADVLFAGPGELRARCRELDWSATPLGAVEQWPQSLRTAADICIGSRFPAALLWGRELVLIHNEAHIAILGARYPGAMGRPAAEVLSDTWPVLGPLVAQTLEEGAEMPEPVDIAVTFDRGEEPRPGHFTVSFSAVRDESGRAAGVMMTAVDTTARRESERRAESLIERMGDAHCVLDREFRIVSVNAATERLLGVSRTELIGRSHWEVFPASVDAPVGRAFRRVVAEGVEQHLTHHYTGEGYDFHIELDAYPTDEGGVAMFWRDVTERVGAEEALRANEEKYRSLFDSMDEGFAVCELVRDRDGRTVDYRYLDLNPAVVRHTNIEPQTLLGRRASELFTALDPWLLETYTRVVDGQEAVTAEHYFPHVDLWLRIHAFPRDGERFAVLYSNITERKRAEAALSESERRYRLLFENMAEGFALAEMIWDDEGRPIDWRYIDVNEGWAQTGVPVSETVGRTAREVNPQIEEYWIETYGRVVQTGEAVRFENYAEGFGKWLDTVAFRHSENRFGLILRDVTEKKRAEAALRVTEARYRTIFESIDEGFAVAEVLYDAEGRPVDLLYLEANPAASRLTGGTVFAGRRASEVLPEADRTSLQIYDRVARTGQAEQVERYYASFDRWYEGHISPVIHGERDGTNSIPRRVAIVFRDVTERRRADEALRATEARQSFLLMLADALRPLADPVAIQGEATRLLREHLDAGWCYYVEWDERGAFGEVLQDATREGLPSLAGRHDVSDIPDFLDFLRSGQPFSAGDFARYELMSPRIRERYGALGFRSMVGAPIVNDGRLVATLLVGDTAGRDWSGDAEALLMDVAESTWAAVERARAEAALRESEEKYRSLFESIDEGFAIQEVVTDENGNVTDVIYLEVNEAFERISGMKNVPGKKASELLPHLEQHWLDTQTHLYKTGKPLHGENYTADLGKWITYRFSRIGGEGSPLIGVVFNDVTERKRRERQQEFLLKLADALRPLSDPVEIQTEAARVLGRHLGAGRAAYAEIEADDAHFVVHRDYTDGVPSFAGRYPNDSYAPAYFAELRAGRTVTVTDAERDAQLSDADRANFAAAAVRSAVAVPLIRGGRLAAVFFLHSPAPRAWPADDVALVEETAERTWAAVERARAEAALRESEVRRLLGLDAAGIGDWSYDVATGVLDCSPHARALHGVGPGEPITVELHDRLVDDEDRAAVQAARARALDPADGEYRIEFRFHPVDGEMRWIESIGRGVFAETAEGPRATHIIGAMIDVTERRRAEDALRASEERFRSVTESGVLAVAFFDLSGAITDANDDFLELVGYTRSELAAGEVRWDRLTPPEWLARTREAVAGYRVTGRIEPYEKEYFRKGGGRFWGLFGGRRIESTGEGVAFVIDITERKRAEETLRDREKQQAFLLRLSDVLQRMEAPIDVKTAATRMLGTHLGVSRVQYHEVDDSGEHYSADGVGYADGLPLLDLNYRIGQFGSFVARDFEAGRPFRSDDLLTDPRPTAEEREVYRFYGIRAGAGIPLLRGGKLVAILAVHDTSAHPWTDLEMELIHETAERVWVAVEKVRTEAALRASEEQFRRSIEDAPIPVIMHAEDGEVLQISRTWTELTGYTLDDVPTFDAWLTHAYGEGADALREHVHALFSGSRRTMNIEFPVRTRDGDSRHWSFSASAPGTLHDGRRFVVGMALDITERRRADAALRDSEERYRTLVENVHDYAIFMVDAAGVVIDWTDGAARVKGYAAGEVLGRHLSMFFTPEDVAAGVPARELAEAATRGRTESEGWRVRGDGTRFWGNEIATAIRDADGRLLGFTKICRDLTERKAFEDALRQAHDVLEARVRERTAEVQALFRRLVSAQEEERRRIARDIHDQLGQQMTALRMNIDALSSRSAADPAAAEIASRSQRLAEELDQSIDFLTWQLRPAALDRLGLPAALEHLVSGWSDRFGIGADFDSFAAEGLRLMPEAESNLYLLTQEALHNVVKHARATHVSVVLAKREGRLMIVIEDNGIGFDVRADGELAAGALGLISMRERATLVGAQFTIESAPGRGTTIMVDVPLEVSSS